MKKIIYMLVCLTLMIVGYVFAVEGTKKDFVAGKGDGTNEKIESVEDTLMLVESYNYLSEGGYLEKLSTNKDDLKYNSLTVGDKASTIVNMNMNSNANGGSADLNVFMKVDTSMDGYFIEGATYQNCSSSIIMVMNMHESFNGLYAASKSVIDIEMDYEMYISNDLILIKYNKYYINMVNHESNNQETNTEVINADELFNELGCNSFADGRWIDVTEAFALVEEILGFSTDAWNRAIINYLGSYIVSLDDNKVFNKQNSVYTLKEEYASDFFSQMYGDIYNQLNVEFDEEFYDGIDADFIVNLSKKEKPTFTFNTDMSYEDAIEINDGKIKYSIAIQSNEVLYFTNINNTVINMDSNIKYVNIEDYVKKTAESDGE